MRQMIFPWLFSNLSARQIWQLSPPLLQPRVNQDGFTYYKSASQVLAAGQTITLTADYQKPTDDLSTTGLPVQPTQPISANTTGHDQHERNRSHGCWQGLEEYCSLSASVGGSVYLEKRYTPGIGYAQTTCSQPKPEIETEEIYCHQCGKRAQAGDVFCRTCGMRLQKEE